MSRGFGLQGADKAERLAARSIYIPKDYRLLPGPSGSAVYIGQGTSKRGDAVYYVMAFRGTAGRPEFHNAYRVAEQRQSAIQAFWDGVSSSQQRKETESAKRAAWVNPAKVGDILYTSWGYDQTNTEFYAVTKVSGKRVWVREIAADGESIGFMQDRIWPAMPIRFCGEETMHIARNAGQHHEYAVKIDSCRTAWLETGRTHSTSSYA